MVVTHLHSGNTKSGITKNRSFSQRSSKFAEGSVSRAARFRYALAGISAATLLVGAVGLWGASAASAHDVLVSSTPSADESVNEVTEVSLEFSAELADVEGATTSAIEVTGPGDSTERFERSTPTIEGKRATVPAVLGAPGTYLVTWRVVSSDGHPISGKYTFDYVGGNGVVSPEPTPEDTAGTADDPTANETPAPDKSPVTDETPKDDTANPGDTTADPTAVSPSTTAVADSDSKTNPWLIVGGSLVGLVVIVGALGALIVSKRRREAAFKTDDDNMTD